MKKLELPLTRLRDGERGVIISINASSSHRRRRHHRKWGFQKRLEDMGLTPGTKVTVVKSAPFHGPIELQVRGSRLAIGRGMAERILVSVER
ncbi:MAG: ferrous iron transport protein A [Candidatus Bathyarchaeota archaeon]|nr:ferrous iron transport protein A [Candidatus Bathyarchaeota archaeon]MDH5494595.1 ferrous iron transport protein A [Candidatus Bathyarchaeota archaeon]